MLHYVLGKKLDAEKRDGLRCEDSMTSSILGTLQYLPGGMLWNILRRACGNEQGGEDVGEL
ncbi:MAG: hypothetical protein CSA07_01575 [Bacteroidia bacterium]|nr:MAG: hypothetical protein CSA07_01575 [Bacteroidia bacterium]